MVLKTVEDIRKLSRGEYIAPEKKKSGDNMTVMDKKILKHLKDLGVNSMKDEEGKLDKTMETILKYGPLVGELVKGFLGAAKQNQTQNQEPKPSMVNLPQAPPEWLNMSPMERLSKKYTRPDWYAAGEKYEEEMLMIPQPELNNQVSMQGTSQTGTQQPKRETLASLARKHPEPPPVRQQSEEEMILEAKRLEQQENIIVPEAKTEVPERKDFSEVVKENQERNQALANNKPIEETKEPIKMIPEDEIKTAIQQENDRYVGMAIKYLNELDMDKFKEAVRDPEYILNKLKPLVDFLPTALRGALKTTEKEGIKRLLKGECSEKYKWLEENNKVDNVLDMFETLKKEL